MTLVNYLIQFSKTTGLNKNSALNIMNYCLTIILRIQFMKKCIRFLISWKLVIMAHYPDNFYWYLTKYAHFALIKIDFSVRMKFLIRITIVLVFQDIRLTFWNFWSLNYYVIDQFLNIMLLINFGFNIVYQRITHKQNWPQKVAMS